jgi:hypothetical protein
MDKFLCVFITLAAAAPIINSRGDTTGSVSSLEVFLNALITRLQLDMPDDMEEDEDFVNILTNRHKNLEDKERRAGKSEAEQGGENDGKNNSDNGNKCNYGTIIRDNDLLDPQPSKETATDPDQPEESPRRSSRARHVFSPKYSIGSYL